MALSNAQWPLEKYKPLALEFSQRVIVGYSTLMKKSKLWLFPMEVDITYLDMSEFFEIGIFFDFIERLDSLISCLKDLNIYSERTTYVINAVKKALDLSRLDLGVNFDSEKGNFYPSGAKSLDEELVNENLKWLQNYPKVLQPYDKGLHFFLEARSESKKLEEVVSNIYKALEAFSHIVCDNTNELTNNQEVFLKKIGLSKSSYYINIFKNYLNYANRFRHAEGDPQYYPNLDYAEVEAFIYLTGLFIRLGIEKLKSADK